MENSLSPISFARPPVAAILPAVNDAREVVSISPVSPLAAINCPSLSTRNTTFALASLSSLSMTDVICLNSSSNITSELVGINKPFP